MESTGYACTKWRVIPRATSAVERAECSDSVVLSIYANATQMQIAVENTERLSEPFASVHLTGPNWAINCSDDLALCEQFADALPR